MYSPKVTKNQIVTGLSTFSSLQDQLIIYELNKLSLLRNKTKRSFPNIYQNE
jgi:hypothetical protein